MRNVIGVALFLFVITCCIPNAVLYQGIAYFLQARAYAQQAGVYVINLMTEEQTKRHGW